MPAHASRGSAGGPSREHPRHRRSDGTWNPDPAYRVVVWVNTQLPASQVAA